MSTNHIANQTKKKRFTVPIRTVHLSWRLNWYFHPPRELVNHFSCSFLLFWYWNKQNKLLFCICELNLRRFFSCLKLVYTAAIGTPQKIIIIKQFLIPVLVWKEKRIKRLWIKCSLKYVTIDNVQLWHTCSRS